MLEFALTGGVAAIGKTAARKAVVGAAESAISRGAGVAAELAAGAAVRTAILPQHTVGKFADRQLMSGLELTEKGIQIADQIGEKPFTSFAKAIGDTFIEFASEDTGGYITKGLGKMLPVGFKKSMEKLWMKSAPNRTADTVKSLWTKAGYSSFVGEIGER
jgi:hypothetical protein